MTAPTTRVLIVGPAREGRALALVMRRARGWVCETAASAARARGLAEQRRPNLALISADRPGWTELCAALAGRGCAVVAVASDGSVEEAVRAMRAGACDLLEGPVGEESLGRLEAAARRGLEAGERADRLDRYRRVCQTLVSSQESMSAQVGSMCDDLAGAYRSLTDELRHMRTVCEFEALIRQELELEPLLRAALEYLLGKLGSTNAAIFLPASGGTYSLGAYVNYDCPRDEVESMLDELATPVGQRFERRSGVTTMPHAGAQREELGAHAAWLEGHGSACVPSIEEGGECLAVTLIFRDERVPFEPEAINTLAALAPVFARQLSRVIRVHHRHKPKDPWGLLGDADDDFGLAA